MFVNMLHLK